MNKYLEAYKEASNLTPKDFLFAKVRKANKLVKLACEKAKMYDELKTPIKPLNDIHGKAFCKCGESVYLSRNKYCNNCGAKIDWSKKE